MMIFSFSLFVYFPKTIYDAAITLSCLIMELRVIIVERLRRGDFTIPDAYLGFLALLVELSRGFHGVHRGHGHLRLSDEVSGEGEAAEDGEEGEMDDEEAGGEEEVGDEADDEEVETGDEAGGEEAGDEEERVEYWVERERVWREVQEGEKEKVGEEQDDGKWEDVEEIFIEEPKEIRALVLTETLVG
ncbi:hypothetical protein NP233_g12279 [Leucocoprinus birnbaumii]|uniref:Uncharacterized protein n=1 Tax=Leucocoprinus birnbaumii TaxID=56174 RepID=A0AAD5YQ61_9AGAR|nr:hypothetical protein NP233_g12279 [Leucocoprinus birnbaumii]